MSAGGSGLGQHSSLQFAPRSSDHPCPWLRGLRHSEPEGMIWYFNILIFHSPACLNRAFVRGYVLVCVHIHYFFNCCLVFHGFSNYSILTDIVLFSIFPFFSSSPDVIEFLFSLILHATSTSLPPSLPSSFSPSLAAIH